MNVHVVMLYPLYPSLPQPEMKMADPICTFLFSVLVLTTTCTIVKDVCRTLMEGKRGTGWPGVDDLVNAHTYLPEVALRTRLYWLFTQLCRGLALFSFSLTVVKFRGWGY